MKKKFIKSGYYVNAILILSVFLFFSCNSEDTNIGDEVGSLDISNATMQTEIDNISEGIDDIVASISFDSESPTLLKSDGTKNTEESKFLPECATITKTITDSYKKVIIDYGEGCTNRNDNFLSGKIILEFSFNLQDRSVIINSTFDNFYFNYKKIEGEVHKTRIKINENGNPQAITNKDLKITWEDGSYASVKGERKREWVEGFGNRIWGDNVFLITGTWTITDKDGLVRTAMILEPLRRESACRFIVSGIVEIQKGDDKINLNYGDGECDDLAIVTIDGTENEIHLRNRRE